MRVVAVVVALATVAAVGSAACSNSSDQVTVNTSCANLSGNFTATSFTATGTQNAALSNNFLSNGGAFTLSFNNGTFNSAFVSQTGANPMAQAGTFTTSGSTITLGNQALFTGGVSGAQTFTCSLNGNTLILTNTSSSYLFAGQSSAQPARIDITLTRV